jgi:hypothetical protein
MPKHSGALIAFHLSTVAGAVTALPPGQLTVFPFNSRAMMHASTGNTEFAVSAN